MARQLDPGALRHRLRFEAPALAAGDGGGGTVLGFAERFTVWAAMFKPRGDEEVLAARLEGKHAVDIVVRASDRARQIATDWRIVDVRNPGDVYAIRFVDTVSDRFWIRLTAEKGVAA